MPQQQFQQLTPQQQSQVIDNYGQQQRIASQNAMIENVVGSVTQAISARKSQNNTNPQPPASHIMVVPAMFPGDDAMMQQAQAMQKQLDQQSVDPVTGTNHIETQSHSSHISGQLSILPLG